jgi:hypothetical protein
MACYIGHQKLLWWTWFKKGCWMMAVIIRPEIGVAMTMDQFLNVRESQGEDVVAKLA